MRSHPGITEWGPRTGFVAALAVHERVARVNRCTVISGETMSGAVARESFEQFVAAVEPELRRALVASTPADRSRRSRRGICLRLGALGTDGNDREPDRLPLSRRTVAEPSATSGPPAGTRPDASALCGARARAALRALPDQQRSVVWLVHTCGWTYSETAEAMGISASAVGTHLGRAMDRLRASLGVGLDA